MNKQDLKKNHKNMMDSMGRYRVASLFWETRNALKEEEFSPMFSLKPSSFTAPSADKKTLVTYPSLKEIYMSYDHIPGFEYDFAMDVFGCWEHWERLTKSMLKEDFQHWRDELTVKLKASALKKLMKASLEPSATGVTAARYLADEGYVPKKMGRTTKEEKVRQLKIDAGIRDDLSSDMDRLGLSVVNGGK